ncbi:MAG: hypothetical protein KDJ87_18895 [Rhizobiaceae bacterium]|nr:hypothetical protein [Rhizobiaceae bacterium]
MPAFPIVPGSLHQQAGLPAFIAEQEKQGFAIAESFRRRRHAQSGRGSPPVGRERHSFLAAPSPILIRKRHGKVANAQIGGVYPLEFAFHW